MSESEHPSAQAGVVDLPEVFDRSTLPGLKNQLDEALATNSAIQLDASSINYVDGAALQFLFFAQRQFTALQDKALLVNVNEYLKKALADLGLREHISMAVGNTQVSDS